jgi:Ribbon-helix-helix protein, copG family
VAAERSDHVVLAERAPTGWKRWGVRLGAAAAGAPVALAFPQSGLWWWAYAGLAPVILLVAAAPDDPGLRHCWRDRDDRGGGEAAAINEELPELRKVTISMPAWMLDDLRKRARQRGITVTELMRRAVSLERMLFAEPENEIILRDQTTGKETSIRLI